MTEHTCRHESDLGEIKSSIEHILKRQEAIDVKLGKLFKILEGNGENGIVTRMALVEATIASIPSPGVLKAYAFICGGCAVALAPVCVTVVKLVGL